MLTVAVVVKNDWRGFDQTLYSLMRAKGSFKVLVQDASDDPRAKSNISSACGLGDSDRIDHIVEKDGGIYDGMNRAAKHCKTPFILYINAGDTLYSPLALQQLIQTIEKNPEADFVCGSYAFVTKDGHEKVSWLRQDPKIGWSMVEAGIFNNRYMHGVPLHNATAIRTAIIREFPYDWNNYKVSGDIEQMLRCWRFGHRNWVICPAVICRFFEGGVSTRKRLTVLSEMLRLFKASTTDKKAVKTYLRSAVGQELLAQTKHGISDLNAFMSVLCEWPITTLSWLWRNYTTPTIKLPEDCIVRIISLSNNTEAIRAANEETKHLCQAWYSLASTANHIKAVTDGRVGNIELAPDFSDEIVIIVADDYRAFTPAIRELLRSKGIKRPYCFINGRLERGYIPAPTIAGVTQNNEKVYKLT